MPKTVVIIPTIRGPSRVQQLVVDPQLHHAVMTVNFQTQPAHVSSAYASFVGVEAGIVRSETGEHRFRAKVSRDIEVGASWKLGLLCAHRLKQCGDLAEISGFQSEPSDPAALVEGADTVLWVTGDVSDAFEVINVGGHEQKIQRSLPLLDYCKAHSIPIHMMMPAAWRDAEVDGAPLENLLGTMSKSNSGLSYSFESSAQKTTGSAQEPRRFSAPQIAAATVALFALIGGFGPLIAQHSQKSKETPTPPPVQSDLVILELLYVVAPTCYGGVSTDDRHPLEIALVPHEEVSASLPVAARICTIEAWGNDTAGPVIVRTGGDPQSVHEQTLEPGSSKRWSSPSKQPTHISATAVDGAIGMLSLRYEDD